MTVAVLVATPLLAFLGGMAGHLLGRRTALEQDQSRRREESMRLLRWAIELALDDARERRSAGLTAMSALLRSRIIVREDVAFVVEVGQAISQPRRRA